jgi:hypothetical protein
MKSPITSENMSMQSTGSEFIAGAIIDHEHYGRGRILEEHEIFWVIDFGKRGRMEITRRNADLLSLIALPGDEQNQYGFTMEELEKTLRRILEEYSGGGDIEMAGRWQGGKLIMQPADQSQKPKEIPIETFFHKIVMLRDRLRVMEQKVNAHTKLTDEDKVEMQQYITKIYGSLTTFNVLFRNSEDQFVGEKGKE